MEVITTKTIIQRIKVCHRSEKVGNHCSTYICSRGASVNSKCVIRLVLAFQANALAQWANSLVVYKTWVSPKN